MDQAAVQALVTDSSCAVFCTSEKNLWAMVVYLLWSSLHPDESMTQADVQELQDEIACITPCMSQKQLLAAIVQLLSDGGGGGGGANGLLIYDTPADLPASPPDPAVVWIASFRDGSVSNVWDTDTAAWI